jgi:hypothetical protein
MSKIGNRSRKENGENVTRKQKREMGTDGTGTGNGIEKMYRHTS